MIHLFMVSNFSRNKDEPNKKTVEKSVTEESSKSNKAKSPYAVKNSDKKAAEAKASKGKGPVAKRRSITETAPKFDDVENAMEALFAGVEGNDDDKSIFMDINICRVNKSSLQHDRSMCL